MPEQERAPEELVKVKTREVKILGFVIGILICLYVAVTAFVMRTNQTMGTTQLSYSALHTTQLKQIDDRLEQLSESFIKVSEDQRAFGAQTARQLQALETRTGALSNAVALIDAGQQLAITSTAGRLVELRKQTADLAGALNTLQADQQRFAASTAIQWENLLIRYATLTNEVGTLQRQQSQMANLPARLDQMRQEMVSLAAAKAKLDHLQFLTGEIDRSLEQSRAVTQVAEANLAEAARLWQRTELLAATAAADPALANKATALTGESTRLRQLVSTAVVDGVQRAHKTAQSASTPEERAAGFKKSEELLALFPFSSDPALAATARKLAAEHDTIRQQLQTPPGK